VSHGLRNAQKEQQPDRCPRVFVPKTRTGSLDYRRTCMCGLRPDHKGQHKCPDCGGEWGSP
jgi:hypothetical protein